MEVRKHGDRGLCRFPDGDSLSAADTTSLDRHVKRKAERNSDTRGSAPKSPAKQARPHGARLERCAEAVNIFPGDWTCAAPLLPRPGSRTRVRTSGCVPQRATCRHASRDLNRDTARCRMTAWRPGRSRTVCEPEADTAAQRAAVSGRRGGQFESPGILARMQRRPTASSRPLAANPRRDALVNWSCASFHDPPRMTTCSGGVDSPCCDGSAAIDSDHASLQNSHK